jgi:hypothetical protein
MLQTHRFGSRFARRQSDDSWLGTANHTVLEECPMDETDRVGGPDRIIYVGPSLYGINMPRFQGEVWRGPAQQGDLLRDTLDLRPKQLVLIDGVFHQSLSVWHKEIVYALLSGIVCIGAASMGALRAAEMHRYGMIGIGKIFERYRGGEEDDSLVAMTFDPDTYRPMSEAPIGQDQKASDALDAIQFVRSLPSTYQVSTTLNRDAISPYLSAVIERILADA